MLRIQSERMLQSCNHLQLRSHFSTTFSPSSFSPCRSSFPFFLRCPIFSEMNSSKDLPIYSLLSSQQLYSVNMFAGDSTNGRRMFSSHNENVKDDGKDTLEMSRTEKKENIGVENLLNMKEDFIAKELERRSQKTIQTEEEILYFQRMQEVCFLFFSFWISIHSEISLGNRKTNIWNGKRRGFWFFYWKSWQFKCWIHWGG